jgi:energy-coupling factor transport system ATP-binding protein
MRRDWCSTADGEPSTPGGRGVTDAVTALLETHPATSWSSSIGPGVAAPRHARDRAGRGRRRRGRRPTLCREGPTLAARGVWVPASPSRPPAPSRPPGTSCCRRAAAVQRVEGVPVASGIDVVVRAGAALAITGPNGVGKSTLGLTLAGLLRPASGTLTAAHELAGVAVRSHPLEVAPAAHGSARCSRIRSTAARETVRESEVGPRARPRQRPRRRRASASCSAARPRAARAREPATRCRAAAAADRRRRARGRAARARPGRADLRAGCTHLGRLVAPGAPPSRDDGSAIVAITPTSTSSRRSTPDAPCRCPNRGAGR